MENSRRDFLRVIVVLGGAGATGMWAGCGGDGGGTDAGHDSGGGTDTGGGTDAGGTEEDAGGGGGCSANIATNHGHTLDIPAADLTAGADRTYDIMGSSLHTHSVTITAAQFTMLAAGTPVMVTSGVGSAHMHMITITCA